MKCKKNKIIDLGSIGIRPVQISTLARVMGFKSGKEVGYKYNENEAEKMLRYMIEKKHKGYEKAEYYFKSKKKVTVKKVEKPLVAKTTKVTNRENILLDRLDRMMSKVEKMEKDMDYMKRMLRVMK